MTDATANATKRNAILNLLSDEETAKVSMAEDNKNLEADDSFVDLEALDKGVQKGSATGAVGHVIAKSAVSEATWLKIESALK